MRAAIFGLMFFVWSVSPSEADDYAGWLYFDSGPDMPLRLHITRDDAGGMHATIDVPAYQEGNLSAMVRVAPDGSLEIDGPVVGGFELRTTLMKRADGMLVGQSTWRGEEDTHHGDVWLHPSAEPLPWVPMESLPDASGVYVIEPGRAIIVSRYGWGELFYTDMLNGRDGFLLAQSATQFIVGEGRYVPTSIAAHVTLHHDESGAVNSLTWQATGDRPRTARRAEFTVEPVAFQRDGVTFAGEITRLPGSAAQPGVVVIGGSDWETAAAMRRYANVFASLGLTVLTFDKRGHGESGGDAVASFDDIALDLVAAADALAARPDVIDDQVGLFGYSRAGWHIPLACSTTDKLAFAVVFVPPAVSPAQQEETRRLAELRGSGVTDADGLALATDFLHAMWDFARTARGGERYLKLRAQIAERGWAEILDGPETLDESEWKWSRLNMHYDPVPALRSVACPILAVFGGADENVTAEQNLERMKSAFEGGRVQDATTVVIEGADHGLQRTDPADASARYHDRARSGKAPEVWPLVYRWLGERVDLAK